MTALAQQFGRALAAALVVACVLAFWPAAAGATETRERRSDIVIRTNAEFDTAHGVRSGSGTEQDPYVISGWDLNSITIKDTSVHVAIVDNTIRNRLVLDWIGDGVHVHDNDVFDLRVNQNVKRTGLPTSGVISDNVFQVVGQLRHFDGVFERNVVGTPQAGDVDRVLGEWLTTRAVNFDGFNGARFRDNVIYGYVEVRLHGHHHSSAWGEHSHHHSGGHDGMDHTDRWHEVWVTGNRITVPPGSFAALQYVDTNHAANDRTATSEENKDLNLPHVHHTRVHITDNELVGAGLAVEIFNADDSQHLGTARGRVNLDRNSITLEPAVTPFRVTSGIAVRDATDLDLFIRDNVINGAHADGPLDEWSYHGVGIDLSQLDNANVRLYDNVVHHRTYGIRAESFTSSVRWFVSGTQTDDVDQAVYTSRVPNQPEDRSADPDPDEEYEGGPPDHGHGHHH
jgi:hypothetical protein